MKRIKEIDNRVSCKDYTYEKPDETAYLNTLVKWLGARGEKRHDIFHGKLTWQYANANN